MTRPPVSVVMPFAGGLEDAEAAMFVLRGLAVGPDDEIILSDNTGLALGDVGGVRVVRAGGESSPSHARNVGAEHASRDWILFLDADCHAPADLLDRFFALDVEEDIGALAGAVVPAAGVRAGAGAGAPSLAARYGAARSFLDQEAHLAHGFMPRAVAANLLVRRAAFEAVGGFYEGVRAAEDTDFAWRLQRAGWRLGGRPEARVEHAYRTSVSALRRQWRGYAAGRAWLARRYEGFAPEPAVRRAARRALGRFGRREAKGLSRRPSRGGRDSGRLERGAFLALDAVLGVEELAGLALSNRPRQEGRRAPARVVLVADRFPARGDPLVDLATSLPGARVEAVARPEALDGQVARSLRVGYLEDDGMAVRAAALGRLAVRHPVRCARDLVTRSHAGRDPGLAALAPAVMRLWRDDDAVRIHALGGQGAQAVARRLSRLAGRPLSA